MRGHELRRELIGKGFNEVGLEIALTYFLHGVIEGSGAGECRVQFNWTGRGGDCKATIGVSGAEFTLESVVFENDDTQMPEIVGLTEAAEIMGWSLTHTQTYIKRGVFPQPERRISSGPLWLRETVERFKRSRA